MIIRADNVVGCPLLSATIQKPKRNGKPFDGNEKTDVNTLFEFIFDLALDSNGSMTTLVSPTADIHA